MYAERKTSPMKGNDSAALPGQHSNDRPTVQAQDKMASNQALQFQCPESSKNIQLHAESQSS